MATKIRSITSFGWQVKPSVPYCKNLRHVKDPCGYEKIYLIGKNSRPFITNFLLLRYQMSLKVTTGELWWMNRELRIRIQWGRITDRKWSQCSGSLVRYHPVRVAVGLYSAETVTGRGVYSPSDVIRQREEKHEKPQSG
jgi:hypothetical protein